MFDEGVLKQGESGRFEAVVDPEESEFIKSNNAQATKMKQISQADLQVMNQQLGDLSD